MVDGVAQGWLPIPANSSTAFRPVLQVFSYGHHHNPYPYACEISPTNARPTPSPPLPPPAPALESTVVRQAVVELFACNMPFGKYIGHGSHWIGRDSTGSAQADGGHVAARFHVKTDAAHATQCSWRDHLENPLTFYWGAGDGTNFTQTIDQLAEVGFEMIVLSFGGSRLVDVNATHMAKVKTMVDYAHSKGIEVNEVIAFPLYYTGLTDD
eukprot:gene2645-1437_t